MNKFYTKKEFANIVSELEYDTYTDKDKDCEESGYAYRSMIEYLLPIFGENIDRRIATNLTSSDLSSHENISDLALYYFKKLAYRKNLDYDNYYNIDDIYYKLKDMGFLECRIDSIISNLTEEILDDICILDWICHCFEIWFEEAKIPKKIKQLKLYKKNNQDSQEIFYSPIDILQISNQLILNKINNKVKDIFYIPIDILPIFYNLLLCLKKIQIFVPKDVLKIIFDLVRGTNDNYWYHGTTWNSAVSILKYGIRSKGLNHIYTTYSSFENDGFYIGNNYSQAINWAKFKSNNYHKPAVIAFNIPNVYEFFDLIDIEKKIIRRRDKVPRAFKKKDAVISQQDKQICVFQKGMEKLDESIVGVYVDLL